MRIFFIIIIFLGFLKFIQIFHYIPHIFASMPVRLTLNLILSGIKVLESLKFILLVSDLSLLANIQLNEYYKKSASIAVL